MSRFAITATVVSTSLAAVQAWAQLAPQGQAPLPAASAPPIIVVVPVQPRAPAAAVVPSDGGMAGGCWVRFYDEAGYRGDQATLVGPLDVPDVAERTGKPWRDWNSAVVGPMARVSTYDTASLQEGPAVLNPRERVAYMAREKTGIVEDVESVRVRCST